MAAQLIWQPQISLHEGMGPFGPPVNHLRQLTLAHPEFADFIFQYSKNGPPVNGKDLQDSPLPQGQETPSS